MARAWWVNQGQSPSSTYPIIWSPLIGQGGRRIWHWDAMDRAAKGDLVIHYARQAVRGISLVEGPAAPAARPYAEEHWNNDGRQLPVEFVELADPVPLANLPIATRIAEDEGGPFRRDGSVHQGYFFPLTVAAAAQFAALADVSIAPDPADPDTLTVEGETDREGFIKLRREQSKVRQWLLRQQAEPACELCGSALPAEYLVAAHIKPRSRCTEAERLDPHVAMLACLFGCDAAFERGDLIVDADGIIGVRAVEPALRANLARMRGSRAPAFSARRATYFGFHRELHLAR
ncbi:MULTISPECIES: hypothetical protein [unclassified Agrococcus]|uniref:hypothetical protein n=1 Tax=unclassified Agrococcus TaxID=2615065 RepID=UPI00360EFAE4